MTPNVLLGTTPPPPRTKKEEAALSEAILQAKNRGRKIKAAYAKHRPKLRTEARLMLVPKDKQHSQKEKGKVRQQEEETAA